MPRQFLLAPLAALWLAAAPAVADAPPQGAVPLSQILTAIEAEAGFAHFRDIEWDDDGYWEVEYVTTEGREVEVRIDPMTGSARR